MKRFILPLLTLFLTVGLFAQVNITKEECEIVFSESGTATELDRIDLSFMKFDSSSTTHLWFKDAYHRTRYSMNIYDLDSIEYLGALDTITDVVTALGVTGNTLGAHTVVQSWVDECGFSDFDPSFLFYGAGSPEGAVVAPLGAIYLNTSGGANTSIYVKETGSYTNTGWVAK